jgi:outer membrane protein assembly factor BamB
MALDRRDGRVAWSTAVREEVPHEGAHATNSFASGSPVSDGSHVYAFFGSRGLYCLDLEGKVIWEKDLGDMRTRMGFGEGASPALHGNVLVVPWDHEGESFVVALDKTSGDELWRAARPGPTSWTTPVVTEVSGRPQVILAGTAATVSYDLASGEEVWRCTGLTSNVIPTPVIGHGMVFLMSGFRGSSLQAVRLEQARGDITGGDAIAWGLDRATPYVPSPVLSGRTLYFLRGSTGTITCFDAVTGQQHYEGQRLEELPNVYASPVAAGGRIYVCGREGAVAVLEDGPEFKLLATNQMGEGIDASPAIAGDEIYLRGSRHLFCIAAAEGAGAE